MYILDLIFIAVIGTLVGFLIGMSGNPKNKVHFYVARDKYDNVLCLYLGKPVRGVDTFHPCDEGCTVEVGNCFFNFGLNPKNFENLKFEDEPVEVFLNLEN